MSEPEVSETEAEAPTSTTFRARHLAWDEDLILIAKFPRRSQTAIYEDVIPALRRLHLVAVVGEAVRDVELGRTGQKLDARTVFERSIRDEYGDNLELARQLWDRDIRKYDRATRRFAKSILRGTLERRAKMVEELRTRYRTTDDYEDLAQTLAVAISARQGLPLILSTAQLSDPALAQTIAEMEEFKEILLPTQKPDTAGDMAPYNTFKRVQVGVNDFKMGGRTQPRYENLPDWPGYLRWSNNWVLPEVTQYGFTDGRSPFPGRGTAIRRLYGPYETAEVRLTALRHHPIVMMVAAHTAGSYRVADILRLPTAVARNNALALLIDEICDDLERANRAIMADVLHPKIDNIDWRKYRLLYEISASTLAGDQRNALDEAIAELLKRVDATWYWSEIIGLALFALAAVFFVVAVAATAGGAAPFTLALLGTLNGALTGAGVMLQLSDTVGAFIDHARHQGELHFAQVDSALRMAEVADRRGSAVLWLGFELAMAFPMAKAARAMGAWRRAAKGSVGREIAERAPRLPDDLPPVSKSASGPDGVARSPVAGQNPELAANAAKQADEAPGAGARAAQADGAASDLPERGVFARDTSSEGLSAADVMRENKQRGKAGPTAAEVLRENKGGRRAIPTDDEVLRELAEGRKANPSPIDRAAADMSDAAQRGTLDRGTPRRSRGLRGSKRGPGGEFAARARQFNTQPEGRGRPFAERPERAHPELADLVPNPRTATEEVAGGGLDLLGRAAGDGASPALRTAALARQDEIAAQMRHWSDEITASPDFQQAMRLGGKVSHRTARVRQILANSRLALTAEATDFVANVFEMCPKLLADRVTVLEIADLHRILHGQSVMKYRAAAKELETLVALQLTPNVGQIRMLRMTSATRSSDFEIVFSKGPFKGEIRQVEVRTVTRASRSARGYGASTISNLTPSVARRAAQSKLSRSSLGARSQQVYDLGYIWVHIWGETSSSVLAREQIEILTEAMRTNPNYRNIEGIYFSYTSAGRRQRIFVENPNPAKHDY